jgi:hypothetical protein
MEKRKARPFEFGAAQHNADNAVSQSLFEHNIHFLRCPKGIANSSMNAKDRASLEATLAYRDR